MSALRVVFMGTPEFAIPTLEKIQQSRHQIAGVVSQPDRPRGRGKKLLPTPVKEFALDHHLSPIFQPEKLKNPEFITQLQQLAADVFVVVAFRILPEEIFTMPPKGTINLHPSLLPKFRGAAPLNWTIISGETVTGITTIFIQKEIDAGNIILQREMPVYPDDTAGTLHDRLAPAGAALVLETLDLIENNAVRPQKQVESLVTPAPKISKEMCRINFNQSAALVKNWIHGLSPSPGAFALLENQVLKLYRAEVVSTEKTAEPPGAVNKAEKSDLWITCNPGIINIKELQLEGRNRLKTEDFLRGVSILPQTILK